MSNYYSIAESLAKYVQILEEHKLSLGRRVSVDDLTSGADYIRGQMSSLDIAISLMGDVLTQISNELNGA